MSKFTQAEVEYMQSQQLCRMATIGANGDLHVVPNSFRFNAETDTIDLGGMHMATTKKYRDALRHGRLALVIDDVQPPWKPRMIEIRGTVEGLPEGGKEIMKDFAPEILRLTPTFIFSFGINDAGVEPKQALVQNKSRKFAA